MNGAKRTRSLCWATSIHRVFARRRFYFLRRIAIPRVDFIAVAPVAQKFSDGTRRAAVSVAILTSEQNIGILNHQILACLHSGSKNRITASVDL